MTRKPPRGFTRVRRHNAVFEVGSAVRADSDRHFSAEWHEARICGCRSKGIPGGIMSVRRNIRVLCPALLSSLTLLAFTLLSPVGTASAAPASHSSSSGAGGRASANPSAAGAFAAVGPSRVLDTRNGVGAPKAAIQPHTAVAVQVTGSGGVPASGVSAVVVNVTATASTAAGHITGYADGAARPPVWNVNFTRGQTAAGLITVAVGANGKIDLFNNSAGTTQLLADVEGYYLAGTPSAAGAFAAVGPSRVLDTRNGVGAPKAAVQPHTAVAVQVTGSGGVPASGVSAVVVNVTATASAAAGHITGYADGAARPPEWNVNFTRGQTAAGLITVAVGANGKIDLFNNSAGTTQLLADVEGYYLAGTAPLSIATQSLHDGVAGLAYSEALSATGGVPPYTWAASGLPAGITVSAGGILSGTPTATGLSQVSVTVKDAASSV